MSVPGVVCFGCEKPTTLQKPICDDCVRAGGGIPLERCALCEAMLLKNEHGEHITASGGYAGKCTALPMES